MAKDNRYTFLFPSLKDYMIAKAMLTSVDNMNKGFLTKEHLSIITMLAEAAQLKKNIQRYLLNIIKTSEQPIARANALSILAKANLLQGENLSNIVFSAKQMDSDNSISQQGPYLAGTDLRNVQLHNVDLRGANLQGAYLSRANFKNNKLDDANLQGVIWSDGRPVQIKNNQNETSNGKRVNNFVMAVIVIGILCKYASLLVLKWRKFNSKGAKKLIEQ